MRLWVRSLSTCAETKSPANRSRTIAQRKLCLLVDERGRLGRLRPRLDRLPEPLQEDEVALDVLGRGALGGGAHDDAAFLHVEALDDVLQPRALGVLEPARDAEPFAVRHVDEEAARQRDLRRQPGALRLHRILDRLDEQLLAARDQVLDLLAVAACPRARARRSRRRRGSRSSRGRSRRTRPPSRGGRCRRRRDRCFRRSSGARAARGRPRRRGRPRSTATRCSPMSTEISSSRFAAGSGARAARRRWAAGSRGAPAAGCAAPPGACCLGCAGRSRAGSAPLALVPPADRLLLGRRLARRRPRGAGLLASASAAAAATALLSAPRCRRRPVAAARGPARLSRSGASGRRPAAPAARSFPCSSRRNQGKCLSL